ncbi:hypothetical protein AMTR_s00024p00203170 [Amborella trichopoda]|uniref:F-box domain-containing protein n=1 Tax=Amborella trichopoda TaxID=13333 RepID=W1PTP5_AMBTC|nr:hypothetical protein AMTR_s00024p00203170 [Amborella trichopoda]
MPPNVIKQGSSPACIYQALILYFTTCVLVSSELLSVSLSMSSLRLTLFHLSLERKLVNSKKRKHSDDASSLEAEDNASPTPEEVCSIDEEMTTDTSLVAANTMLRSLADLPEDTVLKILSGLPAEDICRLKPVCKSLGLQLSSSCFSERHHVSPPMPSETFAIVSLSSGCYFLHTLSLPTAKVALRKLVLYRMEACVKQMACSHGMMCYRTEDDFKDIVVCNPISQQYIILPPLNNHDFDIQGFYFDPVSYNFKVFVWFWHVGRRSRWLCMFNSADGYWKTIAPGTRGVTYSGWFLALHNMLYQMEEYVLLSFNMDTEEWKSIPMPLGVSGFQCSLLEWEGRLCLVQGPKRGQSIIWGLAETMWEKVMELSLEKKFYRRNRYPHNYDLGIISHYRSLLFARIVRNCIEVSAYDSNSNKKDINWKFRWDSKLADNSLLRIFPFMPTLLKCRTVVDRFCSSPPSGP